MACPTMCSGRALISSTLPNPLPPDVYVADVELTEGSDLSSGIRAHVKGPSEVHEVLLKATELTSCDFPLANGRSGFVIGKLQPGPNGRAIVEPFMVSVSMDRYQIPERLRKQ